MPIRFLNRFENKEAKKMTDKIYCPKFIAALLPTIVDNDELVYTQLRNAVDSLSCLKDECGHFSKKHGVCAIVALAEKPPLTVALDIPAECGDVEGWDHK